MQTMQFEFQFVVYRILPHAIISKQTQVYNITRRPHSVVICRCVVYIIIRHKCNKISLKNTDRRKQAHPATRRLCTF